MCSRNTFNQRAPYYRHDKFDIISVPTLVPQLKHVTASPTYQFLGPSFTLVCEFNVKVIFVLILDFIIYISPIFLNIICTTYVGKSILILIANMICYFRAVPFSFEVFTHGLFSVFDVYIRNPHVRIPGTISGESTVLKRDNPDTSSSLSVIAFRL